MCRPGRVATLGLLTALVVASGGRGAPVAAAEPVGPTTNVAGGNNQGAANAESAPAEAPAPYVTAPDATVGRGIPMAVPMAAPMGEQRLAQAFYPSCPLNFEGSAFPALAPGDHVIDTDALTLDGKPMPTAFHSGGMALFPFATITVPAGVTLRAVGSLPLALLSQGPIVIGGTIHVNGANATPTAPLCQAFTPSPGGAGGGAGGSGAASPGQGGPGGGPGGGSGGIPTTGGGGGGGFGGAGGTGGGGAAGGGAYGDLSTNLQGGSGGGGGTRTSSCAAASGGGGGGGLLLSSATTITINAGGAVQANGGNGALSDTGGSGGGSGGGITFIAQQVTNGGAVSANGGSGGPGGCCGGGGSGAGGRVHISAFTITAGTISVAGGGPTSGNPGGAAGATGVVTQDAMAMLYSCRSDIRIEKACYARPSEGSPTQDADVVIAGQQWICDITISNDWFQEGILNAALGADGTDADGRDSTQQTLPGTYLIDLNVRDTFPAGARYVANTVNEVDRGLGAPAVCTAPPLNGPGTIDCSGIDVPYGGEATFQLAFTTRPDFVAASPIGELPISNTACLVGVLPVFDIDDRNNCDVETDLVKDQADLRITKFIESTHDPIRAGEVFTYTIFVDNLGPSVARNVTITDTFLSSNSVSIQSCAFSVSQGGGAITQFTCTTGNVVSTQFGSDIGTFSTNRLDPVGVVGSPPPPGGHQGRIRASFRLVARQGMQVTNTARVTALTPDPDTSNNFVTVDRRAISVADLSITKAATAEEQQVNQPGLMFNNAIFGQVFPTAPNYFASTRVTAGRRIQYTVTVRNNGVSPAENVVLHDRLPVGVQIYQGSLVATYAGTPVQGAPVPPAGANCDTGTPGEVTDEIRCGIGSLNVGQSYTLVFQVTTDSALEPGLVLENDAWTLSDTLDVNNSNNFAFTQNTVLAAADMGVAKSAVGQVVTSYNAALHQFLVTDTANLVTAGKILRYQIQVQNNGPSDGRNVTIQENLPTLPVPGPVTFLRAFGAECRPDAVNQNQLFCDLGDMEAGARETFDIYVVVDPAVPTGTQLLNTATALQSGSNVVPPGPPPAIPGVDPTRPITWDPCTACGPIGSANVATNLTTVNAVADVFITKVDVPAEARLDKQQEPDLAIAGREHRYLITIGNDGPSVALGVGATDTLDLKQAGILGERFLRCEPFDLDDQVTCAFAALNTVTLTHLQVGNENVVPTAGTGTLVPGKAYSFYLITQVDPGYVLDGTDLLATDTANITTTTTDLRTQNNTDRHDTLIIAEADLAITKADDAAGFLTCDPVAPGGTITYDLTVTNSGPSDAADVYVVDQLPVNFVVVDPALVDVTVSRGAVVEVRDDGQITIRVGNDPNNLGVNELGRVNAGSAPVTIRITVTVRKDAACGQQAANAARVETRQNNTAWPPAPQPFPGVDGGPRTPTVDPVLINNAVVERTTIECPRIQVVKTVSFDGKCPGVNINPGAFNQTGQAVTFCFEVTNTGTTFLDDIFLTDTLTTRSAGATEIYSATITAGADPNMPVKPGETVLHKVTVPHLLKDWSCGIADDVVTVTGNPVNSGRTDLPCLEDVTDTDAARINVPCAGVDWRLQLPILANDSCVASVEVQNVGDAETKALMVVWGTPGACPPQSAGPLKVECTGLIAPGSTWHFRADQMPVGANSAVVYSLSTDIVTDYLGQKLRFADLACLRISQKIIGNHEWWLRFDTAYRTQDKFFGEIEQSGAQFTLDFKLHQGEPIAAVVNRGCPDAGDPNVTSWAAYTSVSSDQEGARDPVYGGYTYYTPLVFANKGGLNSILHIHNSGDECSSIEIWLRTQDVCLRNQIADVLNLAPGETVSFDPSTAVGPDWLGNAWISASQPLGIVVDTRGANHFTSYNGIPADVYSLDFSYGSEVSYAPLVYSEYQGWDSALQVQNLSAVHAAKVKVYFLDRGGDIITTLVDWICARGSQTYFLPVIGSLPGNWVGSARAESQEWISPGSSNVLAAPISSVVTLEKWSDPARTTRREAIAYNGQSDCLLYDWQLGHGAGGTQSGSAVFALPMVAKANRGVTTEIAITNLVPKPGFTDFAIFVYDQNHLIDYVCQKLNEKQVEYINLATWGWIDNGFYGSAVVSAVFWEHDVFDGRGVFERNLVGLGAVGVERIGGVLGGADVPGDESKGWEAFPIFDHFKAPVTPSCPGVPGGFEGL